MKARIALLVALLALALPVAVRAQTATYDSRRINAILNSDTCTTSPCDLAPGTKVGGVAITSGGETNTASNLGGGLANYSTKVGVDLRFNSFSSADFALGSNLFTINAAKWLTITAAAAAYQPLDGDLTSIAALTTTAFGRGVLDDADAAALRTTADAQQLDADLTAVAALTTTTGGRSILATTPADDQVYVGDSASAGTWRSIPDCGEAGTLNYAAATNLFSCLTDSGGGGGGISYAEAAAAVLAGF
jgi:hypothetical protein